MKNFKKLFTGVNYQPILDELNAHPELWDQHTERKHEGSPHMGVSDVWVRFRAKSELIQPIHYAQLHTPVWYEARRYLPAVEQICMDLMATMRAVQLGCVLITKIPPGGKVLPHDDKGRWNAEFMNCKIYIPLKSNPGCINRCEDEEVNMMPGEIWSFDNLKVHSVDNNGKEDRITLIVCMRVEP